MKKILRLEVNRSIFNYGFLFSFFIGLSICVYQALSYGLLAKDPYYYSLQNNISVVMQTPKSFYHLWIGGELNPFSLSLLIMILPILVTIPFAASYYSDRKYNYFINILIRTEHKNYYISKWIAVFLSGAFVIIIPIIINILLQLTSSFPIPPIPESMANEIGVSHGKFIYDLYYGHPNIYIIVYLCNIFIFSGLFATLGISAVLISNRGYIALLAPFFSWKLLDITFQLLGYSNLMPSNYINPQIGAFNIYISIIYVLVIGTISIVPIMIQCIKKRDF